MNDKTSSGRTWIVRVGCLLAVPLALLVLPRPAEAAAAQSCAVTGYLADSPDQAAELRDALTAAPAHQLDGVPLDRAQRWAIPAGGEAVLVADGTAPLTSEPAVTITRFGVSRPAALEFAGTGGERLVSTAPVPGLGATTRTVQLRLDGHECAAELAISVDRGVVSGPAGWLGLGSAVLFAALMVLVSRRRAGGWQRRFLRAAPLGLLAGAGEAVLLYELGAAGPASRWPWLLPVAGVALAAMLPLTRRWGPRPSRLPSPPPPAPPPPPPVGPWRPESLFARTGPFDVWRASRDDRPDRVLLKVARPERAGEPAVRLLRAREAEVLARLDHPNCVRLAEAPAGAGPPALALGYVEGTTLRAVLDDRGTLAGPQAIAVVLAVLAGAGAVNELGLVHRGVQPENVWLDINGNVLLAGFELACPGIEHPVAAEGAPPYASPEQLAGESLDARSDLWSCAAVLVELLTGQPPGRAVTDQAEPLSGMDDLPASLADLLFSALASTPEVRPESAARFAHALRQVAAQAYGSHWDDRAALGAALLVHSAIGAAVTGYAAAGVAVSAGAGAAIGTGTAGLGAASAGPAGIAALGAAGTGAPGSASASAVAAPSGAMAAGNAGTSITAAGKAGAATTPVAAAAVAVVAAAVAFVAAPDASAAATEVVTPEAAHVIFVRTVDEARVDDYRHLAGDAGERVEELWAHDETIRTGELAEIVVGVPPEQFAHPAWFVASAELHAGDTVVFLFARFDRSTNDEPWLATIVSWSLHQVMTPPVLDQAGWLAPPPDDTGPTPPPDQAEPAEPPDDLVLVIDPVEVGQQYVDWFNRSADATEVVGDDVLALLPGLDDDITAASGRSMLFTQAFFGTLGRSEREAVLDPDEPTVWLQDSGTAIVTFTVTVKVTNWATETGTHTPCVTSTTTIVGQGRHSKIGFDFQQGVRAEVPVQQPWRGELATDRLTVLIDDDITMARRGVYVPERSIPC